jgi:signal peptidase I
MEPTFAPSHGVLVQKLVYGPERGDFIVFSDPKGRPRPDRGIVGGFFHWLSGAFGIERPEHESFIKRVIGLPGETFELRDGSLFIEGGRVPEPYLRGPPDTRHYGPIEIPGDALFVLGDNRRNSNDSRFGLGFIALDKVIGRAFAVVWPPSRVGWIH